jgi:TPR repeat protein
VKDIFISYKNDGEGNNFAARLKDDLNQIGYEVYFNSHERSAGSFPERLKNNIENSKDFILILSEQCIEQLIKNGEVDWVREEILCAYNAKKNIIPVLVGRATMPQDKNVFSEKLRFILDLEAVYLPEQYMDTPFEKLKLMFESVPAKIEEKFKLPNTNEEYDLYADFLMTLDGANSGDEKAMYELACMYYYGFISENGGTYTNYGEASKWIVKLLNIYEETDNVPEYVSSAQIMLSNMYYYGVVSGEQQSFKKSREILEQHSFSNNDGTVDFNPALEKKVYMLTEGMGGKFDFEQVVEELEKLKDGASNNAKYLIAKFYLKYGMFDKAIDVLEQITENYPEASYTLGMIFLQGLHTTPPCPDVYRAEHYLADAAYSGHTEAMHQLGLLNFRGQFGYKQNLERARELYMKAAQKGHRVSQYDYAWMCKYGLGGNKDIKEAIFFFEKSAAQGMSLSMMELACLYQEEGEDKNYKYAFEWARKAAMYGEPQAEFMLGNFYFFGRGCCADMDNACIWYKKALENGVYPAKIMLDKCRNIS